MGIPVHPLTQTRFWDNRSREKYPWGEYLGGGGGGGECPGGEFLGGILLRGQLSGGISPGGFCLKLRYARRRTGPSKRICSQNFDADSD